MSLFRKPKKIQRRVFSANNEEEDNSASMDMEMMAPPPPVITQRDHKVDKKDKSRDTKKTSKNEDKSNKPKALLSFAYDEDDTEVFQVRKSSNSKKLTRMMDKERRKKRREERDGLAAAAAGQQHQNNGRNNNYHENGRHNNSDNNYNSKSLGSTSNNKFNNSATCSTAATTSTGSANEQCKNQKNDTIQTEIRTDDFVLVVKKSENIVLNGRAALCAGRNDMSDEDESMEASDDEADGKHRFSKPEHLKQMLQSGSIPDAAMIHAARKRRQRAREQGDYLMFDEPKELPKKGTRLAREDVEGDNSDDEERVNMNEITGIKEREERREKFYAVENDYSEEDSEHENNEWENQQIRKGVTGAQLVNAQQESVLSRFMIKASTNELEYEPVKQSTGVLLQQAYAKSQLEKPQQIMTSTKAKTERTKTAALRTPLEIRNAISSRLSKLKELNSKHKSNIERITNDLKLCKMEEIDSKQKAPASAAKYRFYQEIKCYISDLIDCLNEKAPQISDLEKRALQLLSKYQHVLIERRRQDVRDQAKEMAEASKPATAYRSGENEDQIRRTAEREGRRTRRRCEREKNELLVSHLDGMSSDDEICDRFQEQFQNTLEEIEKQSESIFDDTNDDFYKIELILMKFYAWRKTDMDSYNDAFVSLCLPKIFGPLVRLEMLTWSPLLAEYKEIDKMNWYSACMLYAWNEYENEEILRKDPDVNLVPGIIEKILLPKVTEIVVQCWDPLSTTQTLRLIGFINRLGRDFPLKGSSKKLQQLFQAILDKMKLALDNDVFIPIFPKQIQEAKTSFFQRQFCSGLKLFRNFLSWQGIVADNPLRDLAISSLLNRYLLLAMRVCTPNDCISKAYVIVNTLPTVWLLPDSETLKSLNLFIAYIKQILENTDVKNPILMQSCDRAKQILQRLHSSFQ